MILLAECYEHLQEYEKSESYFNQAIKLDAGNLLAKNNYAYYLSLREKNLKLAKKLSMETLNKEPENSTYLDTYAWILYKMNKKSSARKFILRALHHGGEDNKDIVIHAAEIFLANGEYSQALAYFKKATQLVDSTEKEMLLKRITIIENQLN
jgi:Tfp pilus assembly protein PilF